MAIRPEKIKKINNTRLYHVTGKWTENEQTYRQDFVIAAVNEQDALQIGKNHIPLKITKSGTNLDIKVRDYGIPQSNRTYYSSPILPDSYRPVMPGPIERIPVAENSVEHIDLKQETPVIAKLPPQPAQPKEPEQTIAKKPDFTEEEYAFSAYFAMLYGMRIGKSYYHNEKLTKEEFTLATKLAALPDQHLIYQKWAKEYVKHIQEHKDDSNAKRMEFLQRKIAALVDEKGLLSEGDETNHENKENNA